MIRNQKGVTFTELLLILAALALLTAFIFPQIYLIDRRVKKARCVHNLEKISLGLHIYANEEPDHGFPKDEPGQDALRRIFVRGNITDLSVFDCPFTAETPKGMPGGHLKTPSTQLRDIDYLYNRADLTLESPPWSVIVADKPGSHGGSSMHVLTVDGTVKEVKTPPAGDFV